MITPFLIKMNEKYIFLKEDIIELYNEFPFEGNLEFYEETDIFRQLVIKANLNMISILFLNSNTLLYQENRIFELLENGSSSILRLIIDLDENNQLDFVCETILKLEKKILEFRKINYGMIIFFLRIRNLEKFSNLNFESLNQKISIINYNYDFQIMLHDSCCNWIICTEGKNISKINLEGFNYNYIFDFSELLRQGKIEEMVDIIKIIKKKYKKEKIRLFPLSLNRLFLHFNLESYCNCDNGKSVCHIGKSKNIFSCAMIINNNENECANCNLKELCGSCAMGNAENKSCSIKKLFVAYYSYMFKCQLSI